MISCIQEYKIDHQGVSLVAYVWRKSSKLWKDHPDHVGRMLRRYHEFPEEDISGNPICRLHIWAVDSRMVEAGSVWLGSTKEDRGFMVVQREDIMVLTL